MSTPTSSNEGKRSSQGMTLLESGKSRSQHRRDYLAVQELGEALVRMSPGHFDRMPLADALRAAVVEARRLEGSAYRRHLRHLARLLVRGDPEAVRAAMEYVLGSGPAAGARRRRQEARRERLLAVGDEAIQELIEDHPGVDRQRVRRMVRAARAERDAGEEDGREARALVAYLRELEHDALTRSVTGADEEP